MKILIYTDPHWSQTSSIVNQRGVKYTKRLENLITSVSWAEELSKTHQCDAVMCLGDFFDTSSLNSEELTALQEVKWNLDLPHYFLVGNHEISRKTEYNENRDKINYSSTKALEKNGFTIVDKPARMLVDASTSIYFIPYILERDRLSLEEYINHLTKDSPTDKNIVLSHNDIQGIRYGMFESKEGFTLEEIEKLSTLYINGHLHNSSFLNKDDTILNLGNLTGQNFSEDAYRYAHYAAILDTETLELIFFENPHAYNFYKLEINKKEEFIKLNNLKNNAVLSIRCIEDLVIELKDVIKAYPNIVASRVITFRDTAEATLESKEGVSLAGMDYIKKFSDFILQNLGDSKIVREELSHISKGGAQ